MKKIFKTIIQIIFRATDRVFLGGAIENVMTEKSIMSLEKKEDYDPNLPPNLINITTVGHLDKSEFVVTIITATIPVLLLVSLIAGWIDLEMLKQILKLDYFIK